MLDPELAWEISFFHDNGLTYSEYFDWMAERGSRPQPRRGPCPIKHILRDDCIVKAVWQLQAQGLSLRKAYKKIAAIDGLTITDKAVEKAFRARRRLMASP